MTIPNNPDSLEESLDFLTPGETTQEDDEDAFSFLDKEEDLSEEKKLAAIEKELIRVRLGIEIKDVGLLEQYFIYQEAAILQFLADGVSEEKIAMIKEKIENYKSLVTLEEFSNYGKSIIKCLDIEKRAKQRYESLKNNLMVTAPEILMGKLPASQEEMLSGAEYVIGFNQSLESEETEDYPDFTHYINKYQGLPLKGFTPSGRVLFNEFGTDDFNDCSAKAVCGFYKTSGIKFVVVAPLKEKTISSKNNFYTAAEGIGRVQVDNAFLSGNLPDDYVLKKTGKVSSYSSNIITDSINAKYIAGIIDESGNYFSNLNFMKESTFLIDEEPTLGS